MTITPSKTHRLKTPSAHKFRPLYSRPEMLGLQATANDLDTMIANTKSYMQSPQCDAGERLQLEGFLESLYQQRDEIARQIKQAG